MPPRESTLSEPRHDPRVTGLLQTRYSGFAHRLPTLVGMEREDVVALVLRHLRAVLDDDGPGCAAPGIALCDAGATSLDVAEVVARSARELGVDVPRSALAGLTDLGALADLLYLAASRAGRFGLVPGIHREALR